MSEKYEVVIVNTITNELKKGVIKHSNIPVFIKVLAIYNWLLVEHHLMNE